MSFIRYELDKNLYLRLFAELGVEDVPVGKRLLPHLKSNNFDIVQSVDNIVDASEETIGSHQEVLVGSQLLASDGSKVGDLGTSKNVLILVEKPNDIE